MYRGGIIIKSPEQIDRMAAAGAIQARCLRILRAKVRPGVTTEELDRAAEKFIRSQGASPNSMVVHGIPGDFELKRGDIVSLDVGVTKDGWVADAALTVPVGEVSPAARHLLE